MKKKIFYWSPCLNPVGTVISTINSAISLSKYDKNNEVCLINACGEWNDYKDKFKNSNVKLYNLCFNYFSYLPKNGYLGSRLSYFIIYLISFLPLLIILKKNKPDFLIFQLITSLPLTLLNFFSFNTKFILRISGYPKINLLRKKFWSISSKKISIITCPTEDLLNDIRNINIFQKDKLKYLPDAILNSEKLKSSKLENLHLPKDKKIILSVGRLTRQKNFSFLINEFCEFNKENDDYILYIIGDGEEKNKLLKQIKKINMQDKIFLLGFKTNVYSYMKRSEIFVLSSLWEEVGFVIVEAAINNLYIISSNCPNGPKEFLNNGKNGILFENNLNGELKKSLIKFTKFSDEKKYNDKISLKKNALKYSIYRHYKYLKKIIY